MRSDDSFTSKNKPVITPMPVVAIIGSRGPDEPRAPTAIPARQDGAGSQNQPSKRDPRAASFPVTAEPTPGRLQAIQTGKEREMKTRYDVCVIGAGTAGFSASETARAGGHSVLVVSGAGDLGGTCILRGCMPAKTLLTATARLGEVETASAVGVDVPEATIDLRRIVARKRELVDYFVKDRIHELETYPLLRGSARFVARDAIVVEGQRIEADRFIVATGSSIVAPDIPGFRECGFFTSDAALEMTTAPTSLAIVGGGPVGCEFAQYFARLGTRVTLLQVEPALLRKEDGDVGEAIARVLAADGVDVRIGTALLRARREGDRRLLLIRDVSGERELAVDQVMLASNRRPNTANLELANAEIETNDADGIVVDGFLRTTNPNVFAAGDVLGRRCLVHVAEYAGKLAVSNAFAAAPTAVDFDRFEAHAVYTQPQVAVAGLTERLCAERGLAITVRRHPFADVGKAIVEAAPEGFVKMIADGDGRIRGVAIVGESAIDLIGEAIAFIDRGATTTEVATMPHLHPTMGEILGRVADDFTD